MSKLPPEKAEEPFVPRNVIVYEYDDTSATHTDDIAYLKALHEGLQKQGLKVELEVMPSSDWTVSKALEETRELLKYKRVILAFPDEKFCEVQLLETFRAIMQRGQQSFVTVIIRNDKFLTLPTEIREFQIRWVQVDRNTKDIPAIINDLRPFLKDEPKTIDFAFMNSGTGLAWSYYFGYLVYMLPDFVKKLLTSTWRENHPEIPEDRILKKLFIVFTTNCQEPKILNSERVRFSKPINKNAIYRAGLKRNYDFKIQEVKSRDGKESYYGVVCYLNIVRVLAEMRDDPNKGFVKFSESDVRTQGKHCFEKLKLFMKYTYNQTIKIDQSTFDFIEFDTEAANADENNLADKIFNRMKETCSLESSRAVRKTDGTTWTCANQTGVLCDPITGDVKEFVEDFAKTNMTKQITDCPLLENQTEFGLKLIRESKRIFMVLTDEFVKSDAFAKWFYPILDKAYQIKNKRFLVCLNCLSKNADHPKVLELQLLFTVVNYNDTGWDAKVKRELEGDDKDIAYDLQFNNIGAGLAMSWYYSFLKIRVPKVRDVIDQCPALKEKFENYKMSHKVFFLHPYSCRCPDKVSDADAHIRLVDDKEINLPHIEKATRDYTPKLYRINDKDGNAYYAFVEFNAQADTMYRMMQEGFITEPILHTEWSRFCNKLFTLVNHEEEKMDIRNRAVFIRYDDRNVKEGDLAEIVFHHVQYEIAREQRMLPEFIENGATIEFKEKTPAPALAPKVAVVDVSAGGEEEEDFTETTPIFDAETEVTEGVHCCGRTGKKRCNVFKRCFSCCTCGSCSEL